MDNTENTFSYTYSSQQRKEVEAIREKYLSKEENKMDQLRKLHAIPSKKAQAAAITVGAIGALVLGTGMSLCLTDIGVALGSLAMLIGVLVGVIGMVLVALAYPLYNRVLKKQREKISPQILQLTDELLQYGM